MFRHISALFALYRPKTWKLKTIIVSYLSVLNGKRDGNKEIAQINLEMIIKILWRLNNVILKMNINVMNDMKQFVNLYRKINKTKLIKPIIKKLSMNLN